MSSKKSSTKRSADETDEKKENTQTNKRQKDDTTSKEDDSNAFDTSHAAATAAAEVAAATITLSQAGNNNNNIVKEDESNTTTTTTTPSITAEKVKKPIITPEDFPFDLTPDDPKDFDHYLYHLLAYKAEYSNYNVSKAQYPSLAAWLQWLKKEYKAYMNNPPDSSLTEQQIAVLESLHIPITSRGDEHWNRFYSLLVQYKERHGHVLVPRLSEVPGLGDWVTDQRRQYKALKHGTTSQMNQQRISKLEDLGFIWQVRGRPEWETRYNELLQYKAQFGDCKVPQHYKENRALGKWVAKQREQYKLMKLGKHSFLTSYRLEKLNAAGFVWQIRTGLDTDSRSVNSDQQTMSSTNKTNTGDAEQHDNNNNSNNNNNNMKEDAAVVAVATTAPETAAADVAVAADEAILATPAAAAPPPVIMPTVDDTAVIAVAATTTTNPPTDVDIKTESV